MATVMDWQQDAQLPTVLDWAEAAAEYVDRVIIVPKVNGGISRLPRRIGGADVVLGYSVPTTYGGTELLPWEFAGWPVHLLGGTPQQQIQTYLHMAGYCDVLSADGNAAHGAAVRFGQVWTATPGRHWIDCAEAAGGHVAVDMPYVAFALSCQNIIAAWRTLTEGAAA